MNNREMQKQKRSRWILFVAGSVVALVVAILSEFLSIPTSWEPYQWITWILVPVFGLVAIVLAWMQYRLDESLLSEAKGKMILPNEGDKINRKYDFEVKIEQPHTHKFYYLVHQILDLSWPKTQIMPVPNRDKIKGQCIEGGTPPNGKFAITLIEVGEAEHQRIQSWLNGSDFSGMNVGGRLLDRINVSLDLTLADEN